ncbi:transcription initiation factor TFIID subunit 3 isoform 1-T1 [Fundulus diaphanus]
MCENYARSLLRVSVAQICQALGWDAVQLTACDLLSDVLHRYIQQLAKVCHRYSELYGRTDPVLDDLGQAFRLMGVNLSELEDYVSNLEPVAFTHQTPLFPVNKNNVLQFPQPGVRDAEERKDYIPEHMPPLVSLQEAEEEEEEVPPDMGTSAEAMQVALEEDEDEVDEEEVVNDENHPLKRHLDSPDAALGMMPTSKRPRMYPGLSPEWGVEPREPLTSLNPQRVPPGILPSHDSLDTLSPETPSGALPPFRPQPVLPKHPDQKALGTPVRKPKVSSPGRQRTKSPKGSVPLPVAGSPIHSPKPSKERKKSPGRTKSPKSPKSPKMGSLKAPPPQLKAEGLHKLPLSALSERMGKENIHLRAGVEDPQFPEGSCKKPEPDNTAIDDSIAAVIARACAEHEPDPFAFSSGSDSDSNGFSSPRRLTIMEPSTPKAPAAAGNFMKDTSTPLHPHAHVGLGNWTLDDSINEVVRKANQGGPSGPAPPPPPPPPPPPVPNPAEYVSSGSASPPTPEPLLKVFEEKNKMVPPAEVKKKLKKELKTKMKKKEKDKPKDKDREKDKSKLKEKNKEKNREKNKEFSKDAKMPWKEFGAKDDDFFMQRDFTLPEGSIKIKSRDGEGPKKEKEKHKDKKKDKEKSKKDKDKKEKNKDRNKEDKQKQSALSSFALSDMPPLFSPSTCLRMPSMLPSLAPILHEKEAKSKEKEKKKDKKEKKKKKDKDKEREKAKEKEREKEEKRKEKEREKEKREKEKEKIRLEKVKMEAPAVLPSPVIPRLTLRVGAGQDKIVISKVVPNSEPKAPGSKAPAAKSGPGNRPRTPPPPPALPPVVPALKPASPLPPPPPPPSSLLPTPATMPPAGSVKTPVRSVVTETVSTYVIRDEWGNQIWICPGCNKPDDGSPMIGCDDCDDWYHWLCVGIRDPPPEDQPWFCVKCSSKKKDKKHKKKKHKPH